MSCMKKLLITGFEPFGGESVNPSWQAVEALPARIAAYELTKCRIPVVFGEAAAQLIRTSAQLRPDVVLMIGQAGGRAAVTPELVGINLRHATAPDNGGNRPQDEPILSQGNAAYFATVPVRRMVEAIAAQGIPARASYSAGTYVCNDVLYTMLAHFDGTPTRVGFIHIPYSTEQGHAEQPALPLPDMIAALHAAIGALDE